MLAALILVFIVGPLVELYVIIQVAEVIGGWETVALLLVESAVGGWLMKRQGLGTWSRIQRQLAAGELPTRELADGGLIIFSGALMLTPGFLTDVIGFLLLIPPTRAVARTVLMRRFTRRLGVGFSVPGARVRGDPSTRAGGAAERTTGRVFVGTARHDGRAPGSDRRRAGVVDTTATPTGDTATPADDVDRDLPPESGGAGRPPAR